MRVVLLGASGMIGQGVLRECLFHPGVDQVIAIGRSALPATEAARSAGSEQKLVSLVAPDLFDLATIEDKLKNVDACFFCLGVSSFRMDPERYRRITLDLTLSIAATLLRLNPQLVFIFVSGAGTNRAGRAFWARTKAQAEDALLAMPFRDAYMLRPGFIQPLDGIRSRTRMYQLFYGVLAPVMPLVRRLLPSAITTTRQMGRAMLLLARQGYPKKVLEAQDITSL